MDDALERARASRNLLQRLAARLPGFAGYQERETRREVDELLRHHLAGVLDEARRGVAAAVRRQPLTARETVARMGALEKALDAAANRLRTAGSGYAGLFDAFKVGEAELGSLYRFDLELTETADGVLGLARHLDEGTLGELEGAVEALRGEIERRPSVVRALAGAEAS
jgi:hypothetical protein